MSQSQSQSKDISALTALGTVFFEPTRLTIAGAEARMNIVRDFLRPAITIALLFGSLPTLQAQRDIDPGSQAAASADIAKPYEPPSASRSVEVGNFYLRKKKYKAALSRFQEANTTDPTFAPAYLGLGKVYEKIGLKQKALDAYQKYLDALPSSKQADDAKLVHKSIDRLERQLHKTSPLQRGFSNVRLA